MTFPATGGVVLDVTTASATLRDGTEGGQTTTLRLTIDSDGSSSPCTTSG